MNVENEINQLKYQIKLLKFMVNEDEFPFFMYALDYEFNENQVATLIKIGSALSYRLDGEQKSTLHDFNQEDEQLKSLFEEYGIGLSDVYKSGLPTISEFASYVNHIFAGKEISPKYLLSSMKKQSIHEELCTYLLGQIEEF